MARASNTQKGYFRHAALGPLPLEGDGFRMRAMTMDDVSLCRSVLAAEKVDPDLLPGQEYLFRVLATGTGFGVIFERQELSQQPGVVSFGCTAFVDPKWAEVAKQMAGAERLLDAVRELDQSGPGTRSVADVAKENATEGLVGVLFGGRADQHLSQEERRAVTHLMTRTVLTAHAGYNFRSLLWPVASPELAVHLANGGGPPFLGGTSGTLPKLFGIDRTDAEQTRGSLFYSMFDYKSPVIYLSEVHRELVWFALQAYPDEQIAEITGITYAAVKKRWASLFDCVADVRPGLLPAAVSNGVRGPAKRNAVLEYIRLHPEELRPNQKPNSGS